MVNMMISLAFLAPHLVKAAIEVAKNIKQVQLGQDGYTKACGAKKSPAWEFHVVVVTAN